MAEAVALVSSTQEVVLRFVRLDAEAREHLQTVIARHRREASTIVPGRPVLTGTRPSCNIGDIGAGDLVLFFIKLREFGTW